MNILEQFVKSILLEKRRSKKLTLYHGTSTVNLKSILSNGLLKDPPKAVYGYGDDDEEHDQYDDFIRTSEGYPLYTVGGVYFSSNPGVALSAAYEATTKTFGGNRLIIQAQITDRSLILDEDSISTDLINIAQSAIKKHMTQTNAGDISYSIGIIFAADARGEYAQVIKHILKYFIQEIEKYFKIDLRLQNQKELDIIENLLDAIISYIILNMIDLDEFIDGYASELSEEDYEEIGPDGILDVLGDIQGSMDPADYDDQWISGMEFLTRRMKSYMSRQFGDSYRIEQNIGFRGQNKITAIVAVKPVRKYSPFTDNSNQAIVIYGTPSGELLSKLNSLPLSKENPIIDMRGKLPELMKMLDNF